MSGNHRFAQVTRDHTDRNTRDVSNLQIPVANAAPLVYHSGQVYFDTTDGNAFVSVGNAWVKLAVVV